MTWLAPLAAALVLAAVGLACPESEGHGRYW